MVVNSGATFRTIRPHDQASERYVVVARDDHRARKPEELGALVDQESGLHSRQQVRHVGSHSKGQYSRAHRRAGRLQHINI